VGGLGAFGGFAIPPIMETFVTSSGPTGFAKDFVVFIGLAILSLLLSFILKRAKG
jgi:NNP family nitrate/nitrite transporter-like MFS transporter